MVYEEDLGDCRWHLFYIETVQWQGFSWTNRVSLFVPKEVKGETVGVLITGSGSEWGDVELGKTLSLAARRPFAIIYDIPNQPLWGLREDNLIAHTFVKFAETKDPNWPLLIPMVEASRVCLNFIERFLKEEYGFKAKGFVVTGASKRGWTTWLLAVKDKRVVAIAPIAFDNLNFARQLPHQVEVWGGYSEKISEYTERSLPELLGAPVGRKLLEIVDPFSFCKELSLPKLIIVGTNDRYWPVDAATLYYGDLPGTKFMLYAPNEGHKIRKTRRIAESFVTFWEASEEGDLPEVGWEAEVKGGKLRFVAKVRGARIIRTNGWYAVSTTRDFRDSFWETVSGKNGVVEIPLGRCEGKYVAAFGEVCLKLREGKFVACSTVRIVPLRQAEETRGR